MGNSACKMSWQLTEISAKIIRHGWCESDYNMSNFHPPEVVGRGSETQIQVGENLNKISLRF